jgi:D-alanyl-D-alanine dipeptidase
MNTTLPARLTPRQLVNLEQKAAQATLIREAREAHNLGEHVGVAVDLACVPCALRGTEDLSFMGNGYDVAERESLRFAFTAMNQERKRLSTRLDAEIVTFGLAGAHRR